jgi:hypothetical protein
MYAVAKRLRARSTETAVAGGFRRVVDPSHAAVWSPAHLKRELRASKGVHRRGILRLLAAMGQEIRTVASLGERRLGAIVRLSGDAVPLTTTREGAIWWISGGRPEDGRVLSERAYDFLLDDGTGEAARIVVSGGYLLDTTHLRPGEGVTVVGFYDRVIDQTVKEHPPRGVPMRAVLRSGGDLPLLITLGRAAR